MQQDVLVRPASGARGEHVPGGEEDQRQRRRLDVGEARGQRQDVPPRHGNELGVAAVAVLAQQSVVRTEVIEGGETAHAEAAGDSGRDQAGGRLREVGHPGAGRCDVAGDLAARHERQREAMPGDAVAEPEVEVVERAGAHAHRNLTGTRNRIRPLTPLERFGTTVPRDAKAFHAAKSISGRGGESRRLATCRLCLCIASVRASSSWLSLSSLSVGAGADVAGKRTVDLPLLLDLPGDLAPVRYTPGALDRAAAVQKRFELLAEEFARTRFQATAIVIYVLSPEDWAAAGLTSGYGDPVALGTDALVVPAWADAEMVARVRGWLGGEIPQSIGLPLLATREEAGALGVSDILAQIAAGRLLAKRARLAGDAAWIAPVMEHIVARLAWDRFEPGRMREIAALLDAMAARDPRPGGHALAEWSENLPLPGRAWFETRFLRGADLIVTTRGSRATRRMLNR